MGDNVELRDRDGVRTPMQWNDSVHGGFSNATIAPIVPPPIDDARYGYGVVNVDARKRTPGRCCIPFGVSSPFGVESRHSGAARPSS